MEMTKNTILITGGTSGIGLELAKQLLTLGNTVLVTGRDQKRIDETKKLLPKVHTLRSDASDPQAIKALYKKVVADFPDLNVLINNAGIMRKTNLQKAGDDLLDLTREIEINLMGPVRMVNEFLPHLKSQDSAAIVNVTSGLAFVPLPISPIYCATKAGLHSYTESLRVQLQRTNIKVIELAPPGTETPLFNEGFTADDLKGAKAMRVEDLAAAAIAGFKKDVAEIRPGLSNMLKLMSRVAPGFIFKQLSKPVDAMLQ